MKKAATCVMQIAAIVLYDYLLSFIRKVSKTGTKLLKTKEKSKFLTDYFKTSLNVKKTNSL